MTAAYFVLGHAGELAAVSAMALFICRSRCSETSTPQSSTFETLEHVDVGSTGSRYP